MEDLAVNEIYLGDGLYASFDGWQILLRAPRENGDHMVALEPEVFNSLLGFARQVNERHNVRHFDISYNAKPEAEIA
jgi:hypothetical protein